MSVSLFRSLRLHEIRTLETSNFNATKVWCVVHVCTVGHDVVRWCVNVEGLNIDHEARQAPESAMGVYDARALDMWSIGMIFYESMCVYPSPYGFAVAGMVHMA